MTLLMPPNRHLVRFNKANLGTGLAALLLAGFLNLIYYLVQILLHIFFCKRRLNSCLLCHFILILFYKFYNLLCISCSICAIPILSSSLDSFVTVFLIDWRNFESSATDIAEEYIPTNNRYEDSPIKDTVTSPNGGYGVFSTKRIA